MGGIAGIVDLTGKRAAPPAALRRMAVTLAHRGPAGESYGERPGVALAVRWREPAGEGISLFDEQRQIAALVDGQFYNADELLTELGGGLQVGVARDTALVALLWERYGTDMFDRLAGQFAVALWDDRQRRLVLARDHFGICPLHWTRQGDWLLFASEIKALLASGMVEARTDLRGIHHLFTFFGMPGPVTCFEGVSALLPGRYLDVQFQTAGGPAQVHDRIYWQMSFPDHGQEDSLQNEQQLVDQYEEVLLRSLDRRLRAAEPVVAYSSGGLDSSLLVAMASRLRGGPLDTFTFRIEHPHLDETSKTEAVVGHVGNRPEVVGLAGRDLVDAFPRLVDAAESPIVDVSAAALLQLAERVRAGGHHTVITGEGADELQAGYPWFRIQRRLDRLDRLVGGLPLSRLGFRGYVRLVHSRALPWQFVRRSYDAVCGKNAWLLAYMLMAGAKCRFFSRATLDALGDHVPLDDLQLDRAGLGRWHPLNRSLYLGTRVHLAGLHLAARGDRAAGRSSVETRYPFLDREVFDFLAPLDPAWKLRGLEDKFLQRRLTDRWLPPTVTEGRKRLLHAPLDAFHRAAPPAWVEQLLSEESLRKTGYFDVQAVRHWQAAKHHLRSGFRRLFVEMGLVAVLSTQLWHHRFMDSSLADLPGWRVPRDDSVGQISKSG